MSVQSPIKRMTVPQLRARKNAEPIVMMTAYDVGTARRADDHADVLLVGDSLGMVVYGLPNTLAVSLDMMIAHGQAVVRGAQKALVTIDMPFGSYEKSPEQAFASCARVLAETGAQAVKLEGGARMASTVAFLTSRGIPVVGHVGMTPQSVNAYGGFKVQGRDEELWPQLEADIVAIADAGAFLIVVEAVAEPLARRMTRAVDVPTIGIGASAACDGQVLVTEDMLGLHDWTPSFVREFGKLGKAADKAIAAYAKAVRERTFPSDDETYS